MLENYYEILDLDQSATQEEIRQRYNYFMKKYEQDSSKSEMIEKLKKAYETLENPESRKIYDKEWEKQKEITGKKVDEIADTWKELLKLKNDIINEIITNQLDEETYNEEIGKWLVLANQQLEKLIELEPLINHYKPEYKYIRIIRKDIVKEIRKVPTYSELFSSKIYYGYSDMILDAIAEATNSPSYKIDTSNYPYAKALCCLCAKLDTKDEYELTKMEDGNERKLFDEKQEPKTQIVYIENTRIPIKEDNKDTNTYISNPKLDIAGSKKIKYVSDYNRLFLIIAYMAAVAAPIIGVNIETSPSDSHLIASIKTVILIFSIIGILSTVYFVPASLFGIGHYLKSQISVREYITNEQLNDYIPNVIEAFLEEINNVINNCTSVEEAQRLEGIFKPVIERSKGILAIKKNNKDKTK